MGRSLSKWRSLVCLPMTVILPLSLLAQDSGAAMLRSSGNVLVNKNSAPASSALFPNDLIETQQQAVARIEASGSTADLNSETIVQFQADELVLEHGSLSVNTSRGLRVRVGCVTVTPVDNAEWTHYDVADRDGKVTVSALKKDVYIDSRSNRAQEAKQTTHSNRVIVRESEQKSREERCGGAVIKESARMPGVGAILNSPWAKGTGLVVIGLTCILICTGGSPISPSDP